jgi:hypothetical protein
VRHPGLILLVLVACAGAPEPREPETPFAKALHENQAASQSVRGTSRQLTLAPHADHGPDIDAPVGCTGEVPVTTGFVVVHGHGKRVLVDRAQSECDIPDAPVDRCPTLAKGLVLHSIVVKLRERWGADHVNGPSRELQPCGAHAVPLDVYMRDWYASDEALWIIHAELERWNAAGDVAFVVRPPT